MHPIVEKNIEKAKNFWGKFTLNQKIMIGAGFAFVVAVLTIFTIWATRPNFQTLYTNLSAEDANRVVNILKNK